MTVRSVWLIAAGLFDTGVAITAAIALVRIPPVIVLAVDAVHAIGTARAWHDL